MSKNNKALAKGLKELIRRRKFKKYLNLVLLASSGYLTWDLYQDQIKAGAKKVWNWVKAPFVKIKNFFSKKENKKIDNKKED